MSEKPAITVDPLELSYIDEEDLQTKTDDEEWQDAYDMGDRPADYPEPAKSEFKEFIERMGYEL